MNSTATRIETSQPQDLVTKLRNQASKDKAFNAVCHIFAMRERSRAQVTLSSLMATMLREGFSFDRKQYVEVLKFLASVGLGRLDAEKNGRVKALKDIKVTLKSVGLAAVSKQDALDKASFSNTFKPLPSVSAQQPQGEAESVHVRYPAKLTVSFDKDEVSTFSLPKGISAKELGELLTQLYRK